MLLLVMLCLAHKFLDRLILPSTHQIADRMKRVVSLMNAERYDPVTVADLARAMDLTSPAELDAIFQGHHPPTFAMLDQFCDRFAINKEWLTTGRSLPFSPSIELRYLPHEYFDLIEESKPEAVYAVRSTGPIGEAFLIVKSDAFKYWVLPGVWHVSDHVGGGGTAQLLSLYRLFKRWLAPRSSYFVFGRCVPPAFASQLFDGECFPGMVERLPQNHWWDDLTDLDHPWTSRNELTKSYGKGFVLAQDIIRAGIDKG